jgi:site-specific recombinase XerD
MVERAGKSFQIWYQSIKGNSTEAQRLGFLENFLTWRGCSYEEFYQQYYDATRSADPRDLAALNSIIVAFYKELRSKGLSSGYAKNHVGVVVGFLQENGLSVNFTKAQKREMARKASAFKDNWTKEEIRQLLAATTSPRNAAIIHCLKDSGMAVSDLADLKISDLKKALNGEDKFAVVEYVRNKTEERGSPCFGFESLDAIRSWLRWRAERGYNCDPESPLFTLVQNQQGGAKYTHDELLKGIPMNGEAITGMIIKVIRRAGLTDKKLSAHCFRIYNASALESGGVNKNLVYQLQARQIPDSGRAYSKGEVLSSYQKAYEALAVGGTKVVELQDSRIAELEAKQLESDAKIEKLTKALEAIYEREKPKA